MRFPRKRPLHRIVNEEEAEIMKSSKKGIKNTSKFISNKEKKKFKLCFRKFFGVLETADEFTLFVHPKKTYHLDSREITKA